MVTAYKDTSFNIVHRTEMSDFPKDIVGILVSNLLFWLPRLKGLKFIETICYLIVQQGNINFISCCTQYIFPNYSPST